MFQSLLFKLLPDRDAFALISRLLREHGASNWRRYAFSFVFMAIAAGCTGATAYLIGTVINATYVDRNFAGIVGLGLVLMALFIAKGFATYAQSVTLMRIANRIIAVNRKRLFDRLLNQNLGYFADRHSSEFVMVLQTGATAAASALNIMITAIGRDLLTLISLVTVMVLQDPLMSLIVLGIAPPAIFGLRILMKRVRTVFLTEFGGSVRIVETLQESLQGIRLVKTYTLEPIMRLRFNQHVDDLERASNKMARVQNRANPLMETLGGVAVAMALIYGGYRVIITGSAPGEFVSFLTAFLLAYEPAKRLARVNLDLTGVLVGTRLMFQVIDAPNSEPVEDGKPPLSLNHGRIEFADVGFSYRPNEPVLQDLSFVAEPGTVTALVGLSGGGKSTILRLVCGLYDVQQGAVLIDGQNVADVSRRSLRQSIAYVGQETFLFRGTIRENIAVGKSDATEDEITAAAVAAHAEEFIRRLPNGYDSLVGEHGFALSGGQRQRIAVARALLRDARIILLDEATASLDSESEQQVQQAIHRLCAGRTTIMVAHRLHTIVDADRICVIEDGHVVESGSHDDLLHRGSRYASLFHNQTHVQSMQQLRKVSGLV